MANNRNKAEPSTAPPPDQWYDLSLGSSFNDHSSKFCTLRYEFKPASIDKSQPGSLHKNKDNRVMVEFHNNQPGKPKVSFEGSSEDYKDNDAVLFFDGQSFRLERLHRAVKRLRHVRLPGESTASGVTMGGTTSTGQAMESRSPPLGKAAKSHSLNMAFQSAPVEVERIDIGESESPGSKPFRREAEHIPSVPTNMSTVSPESKNFELVDQLNAIFEDGDDSDGAPDKVNAADHEVDNDPEVDIGSDNDILNHNNIDDEIADVDVSDDEADKGPNAAEALRAQVNAAGSAPQTSSSNGSSGSSSSSSSSSSSGESSSSDEDEASHDSNVSV